MLELLWCLPLTSEKSQVEITALMYPLDNIHRFSWRPSIRLSRGIEATIDPHILFVGKKVAK